MVGVAGKSEACNTCRRRRVKCDLRRPTCFRCEKADTLCAGYERDPIFINRTPTESSLTATSVISEARREDNKQCLLPKYEKVMRSLISQATQPAPYLPVEFRRTAVGVLEKIYLPQGTAKCSPPLGSTYDWVRSLDTLTEKSQALDLSMLALCIVQTALTKTSSVTLEEGLQAYSEALRNHRTDLQDEQKRYRDETFATIIVLTTCELFASPIDLPWRVHALGLSEILRLRGISGPQTRTFARLCSRMRTVCLLDGLTKEQPLFLSPSEWPDVTNGNFSKPLDLLLDIIINVPTLLSQSNTIMDGLEAGSAYYEMANIVPELINIVNKAQVWQQHTRTRLGRVGLPYRAVISPIYNPADDKYPSKLFPFNLEFECVDSAITTSFTWSVQLQALQKIISIHQWIDNHAANLSNLQGLFVSQDLQPFPTDDSHHIRPDRICISVVRAEADRIARLLCQFIGYCQRVEMGTIGPQCCRYPTWILRQFFRQNYGYERELEWVLNVKHMTGPGFHPRLNMMEFGDRDHL